MKHLKTQGVMDLQDNIQFNLLAAIMVS